MKTYLKKEKEYFFIIIIPYKSMFITMEGFIIENKYLLFRGYMSSPPPALYIKRTKPNDSDSVDISHYQT